MAKFSEGKNFKVRDISLALSDVLEPVGETVVAWKDGKADYPHTNCLIFRNA